MKSKKKNFDRNIFFSFQAWTEKMEYNVSIEEKEGQARKRDKMLIQELLCYLAAVVAGFPVDVQLKVLVLVEKAPPGLVHQEVVGVFLGDQVGVVTVGDWSSHLNDLARHLVGEETLFSLN